MRKRIAAALGVVFVSLSFLAGPATASTVPISAPKGTEGNAGPTTRPTTKLSGGRDDSAKRNEALIGSHAYRGPSHAPGAAKQTKATACSPECHMYVSMYQYVNPAGTTPITGMGMRQEVGTPVVRAWDAAINGFSLMQNAVQDTSVDDAVEAGWAVEGPFSGPAPKFFVSSRTRGNFNGWGTGFVPVSSPLMSHGTDLSAMVGDGVGFRLFWTYFDTSGCAGCEGWWLSYAKAVGDPLVYIGHFPDSVWTTGGGAAFTGAQVDLVQGFGEIAVDQKPSQTGMGQNSILTANRLGSSAFGLSGPSAPAESWNKDTACTTTCDFSKWNGDVLSATTWNLGGPGGFDDIVSTVSPANDCSGEGTGTNPSGMGAGCTYENQAANVPVGAPVTQIDMSAGTACRGNVGTSTGKRPIRNIALTGVKKMTFWPNGTCTGVGTQFNHGRIVLPVGLQALANLSYRVDTANATCAAGPPAWPASAPTC